MPATVEWSLKKELGPDRWAKYPKASADEAPRSLALVCEWIKGVVDAGQKEAAFGPPVLEKTKTLTAALKGKALAADPVAALASVPSAGVKFAKLDAGKTNAIELNRALKPVESGSAVVYLYSTKDKRYNAVAIGTGKGAKRLFDPFKGQLATKNPVEIADYVFTTYGSAFDSFVMLKATGQDANEEEDDDAESEQEPTK